MGTSQELEAAAQRETVTAAGTSATEFLETLAEKLGGALTQSAVYGQPIECDGVTIIPVARVGWGFGGGVGAGRGKDAEDNGSGAGGGGGAVGIPIGYIQIKAGDVVFKPIREPLTPAAISLAFLAAGISLPRIVRTLRRLARS